MASRQSERLFPFRSAIDPLLPAIQFIWRAAYGYELENWQVEELRSITETKPDGTLRWRQYLLSMGRQNGKSEILTAIALWMLLSRTAPLVIGVASSADQARIVYDRALQAIRNNPSLAKRFDRLTDTRGLRTLTGGRYEIKASKGAALQGLAVDLAAIDELHITKPELWDALVAGTGGRDDCIVLGITTAGDDNSELLKRLYELADAGHATLGYSIYEAPDATIPKDDETLAKYLTAANPAIASGRRSVANVIADVRAMPEPDAIRYFLNRFVAAVDSFIPAAEWARCAAPLGAEWPEGSSVFAFDRTPDWGHAAVAAAVKLEDGTIRTEIVASLVKPTLEQLVDIGLRLKRHTSQPLVMDGYALGDVAKELKRRGVEVEAMRQGDAINASSRLYARIKQQRMTHAGDPLLSVQIPRTARKNVGESFRISRQDSSVEIDAVMATAYAVYQAERAPERTLQVF